MTLAERRTLPGSLAGEPRLERWLRLDRDGTVTLFTGKVEIGQGIGTALAQIVADELDVALDRVRVAPVDTARSPDEGVTSGSRSMEESGAALRQAAAEARRALLERAAARLEAPIERLTVKDGVVAGPSGTVTYAELLSDDLLAREASGDVPVKDVAARTVIGTEAKRIDIPPKVRGAPVFVQDLVLPGMLHARVLRAPGYGATLRSLDEAEIGSMPGVVAVVRDGSFAAVVARREEQAIRALFRARRIAGWDERPLPAPADARYLLEERTDDILVEERRDDAALARAARTVTAEYSRPFLAHAAIGPSCAVATFEDGRYTVWTHSQGVHPLRHELAKVLHVAVESVRVIHLEGAGCYGHNGSDDAALDAALVARAVPGRPVRVQWMRDDEFAWEPYGTAMLVRLAAKVDGNGDVVDWTHELWGHGHGNRPSPGLPDDAASTLAASYLTAPFVSAVAPRPRSFTSGGQRNAVPLYAFPALRVVNHYVPQARLRVSALRSLGAHANVFAIESFMDELAAQAGADPIEYRLRYLRDERARAVIEKVAGDAGWRAGEQGDGVRGRGVGFARYKNSAAYFAAIAEIELGDELRVTRVLGAVDAGLAVNPDGVRAQCEGGIVQAVSWTLREQVRHDERGIVTRGWDSYPILRFPEVPDVAVAVLQRDDAAPLGVGEAVAGPVTAAIANAVANASGVRLRDLPFTRERIVSAI